MRILILSDLHIGNKARSRELCPYPEGTHKDDNLVSTFIVKAQEYQKINGPFDFIIIPGDITNQSNLIEYDCGSKFITKILSKLSLTQDKVIFVPGNHDVDWSVLEGKTISVEEKPFRRSHKYNTLKDSTHLFSSLASADLVNEPFIKKWEFPNVVYFGFNSSWHDDAFEDNHFGLIDGEHIKHLRTQFEKTDLNKLRIFVVHHHLHQFQNPHPSWRDISIMQNAQPLLELLTEFEFNFVIHGHRHQPNFLSLSINRSKVLNILSAGSYCCEIPTSVAGHIGNLFHVLEIDNLAKCNGRILSWAYNSHDGWVESREHDGILHENPFGNEIAYDDLYKACLEHIVKYFETNKHILYSHLVDKIPDLKYLQLNLQEKLFRKLETELNVRKTVDSAKEIFFIKL
ncbi:MAG: metallophosphoesterase [Bacteroidota bacterium]|nr:metallophosphoesterase [Bacteroidota bacterium]